jgi:hypothetical protein
MLRSRPFLQVTVTSLAALAFACSEGEGGQSCETDATCPAQARCLDRLCVGDAPPVAEIDGVDTFVERALATFDGSDSHDPDDGDSVVAWNWSVRSIDASCAAPAAPPSAPQVHVRFPCVGRWAVELVVVDELGTESTVGTHEIEVTSYYGAPRVTAGADQAFPHRCAGEPLRCTTVDPQQAAVELSLGSIVTANDVDASTVVHAWSVTPPPGLALSSDRRVLFSPGPDVQSPTVVIETDGTAISGQWLFTVEVRDAAGVVGTATQVVTVENEAPVITAAAPEAVPHRYHESRRFIAGGEIPVTVVDPDGDPLTRRPLLGRHLNDGPEDTFDVADEGDVVTYYVTVRYDEPADAGHLIGEGVVREIELTVDDVNGATVSEILPLVIGNRPPRAVTIVSSMTTGHRYDAPTSTYRARAPISRFVDDDGDPMFGGSTGDGICHAIDVDETGQAWVDCELLFQNTPAMLQFATDHVIYQRVEDPWVAATTAAPATIVITNRPPTVTSGTASFSTSCGTNRDECCEWDLDLNRCVVFPKTYEAGSVSISPHATDPDGDPVELTVSSCGSGSQKGFCTASGCPSFAVTTCAFNTCGGAGETSYATLSATDGSVTDVGSISLLPKCG